MTRRARAAPAVMAAAAAAWAALFAYLARIEPVLHDGWPHVLALAHRPLSPAAFAHVVADGWLHGNPRLGQWLTYLAYAPGPYHAVLAAAGALGTVLAMFVLAHARWPRPRELGDTGRLVVLAALIWPCVPNAGQMLGYRPFTGNYVWAFAVTLWLAAPYRLALARPAPAPAPWPRGALAAAAMLVLGGLAGMCNEHTGPTALAAIAAGVLLLRRRDRRWRPWPIAGLVGLAAGTGLLLGAPGQDQRYGGLARAHGLVGNVLDRGLGGNLHVVAMFLLYTAGAWALLGAAVLGARRRPGAVWRRDVAVLVACALAIVATVLVSPKWGPRLFYAPAVLLVIAVAIELEVGVAGRRARALGVAAAAAVALGGAVQLVRVQVGAHADDVARVARLRAAAPGAIVRVPPLRRFFPGWWTYGDDFRSAPLREHVARAAFGAGDVVLDTDDPVILGGAGVTLALDADLDPPAPALARAAADPDGRGFSDQVFTREGLDRVHARFAGAVAALRAVPGHRLAGARLRVVGLDAPALGGRPLLLASWQDGALLAPAWGRARGRFRIPAAAWPPGADETYVVRAGAGATTATATPDGDALVVPAALDGPGGYLLVACDPRACHVLAADRRR